MSALPHDFPEILTANEIKLVSSSVSHCRECLGRGWQVVGGHRMLCHCVRKAYERVISNRRKSAVDSGGGSPEDGCVDSLRECSGTGGDGSDPDRSGGDSDACVGIGEADR